ncbi:DUF455 family protein [Helicobacter jaachi]|uniref:DUF455 family protein n=1 Tax=Helicobacter jaachi TaxID=1677920 RepID=A0A4U8T849_9HELI|nr:DUF455 family protein [Helicobacter jaachi]TLD95728.1 DUF455 family protein [Helicobacter jaachi]
MSNISLDTSHKACIFMGELVPSTLFFMRLENAFLLAQQNTIIEIVSQHDNLERDLMMWCRFKGEEFIEKRALGTNGKADRIYILRKLSPQQFQAFNPSHHAPLSQGLAPNGVQIERASPEYHFTYTYDNDIASSNIESLYEEAKKSQWNASSDIKWQEIPHFSQEVEFAIAQIMTYLSENEFSALYIPSRFLGQISPYFTPIPLLLSSIIGDESRHIESFIKRANATGLGVQYSTRITQQSLYSLWAQKDYFVSSFLLHIMGEGTFIDLLHFLSESFRRIGDEASAYMLQLVKRDEARHVAYGMSNVKYALSANPAKIALLKDVVFARKHFLDSVHTESSLLLESLSILRAGGAQGIARGFEEVLALKQKMERNRVKRLVECGIDEELAWDLSKAHTPNFM